MVFRSLSASTDCFRAIWDGGGDQFCDPFVDLIVRIKHANPKLPNLTFHLLRVSSA